MSMRCLFTIATFCLYFHSQPINPRLINKEQLSLLKNYQIDQSFLKEFPFSLYRIIESTCQGKFFIDKGDYIKNILASPRIWEEEIIDLIQKYAKPNTITIDIGAHIGTHTMMMSRCVGKDGVVIAFEPQAKLHRELFMNLKLNKCKNVLPLHSALGSYTGTAYMEPERPNNQGYRCISSKQPTEQIPITTLDSFQLTSVSLIKIDVESYELEVLQGAYNTIMNNKPVIIIEIGGGWSFEQEENIDPEEHLVAVINMLENVFKYDVTPIPMPDGSLINGDYLAIPKNETESPSLN